MKNLINKRRVIVFASMVFFLLLSCENEPSNEMQEKETTDALEIEEFPESKLISFKEIERITSKVLPEEMNYGNYKHKDLALQKEVEKENSREGANYYFYANVISGPRVNVNYTGELDVNVTYYGDVFRIIRGSYILANGDIVEARGAVIADGTVYLILELPNKELFYGIGKENPANGGIVGRFSLYTLDGAESKGKWIANIKEIEVPEDTILNILINDGRFKTLIGKLQVTGLSNTLYEGGPFTFFAPTDAAFAALKEIPEGEALKNLLLYHVVPGKMDTRAIINNKTLETLLTDSTINIDFNGNGTLVIVNENARIIHSNIETSNGYIHVVDVVLVP